MASDAPGLESGIKILELLADRKEMGFNELKKELELSPTSLNRYIKTLMLRSFVTKNSNQKYVLGKKLISITGEFLNSEKISMVIQPVLERISKTIMCTSIFIQYKYGGMICAGKSTIPNGLAMQNIGEYRTDYVIHPWGYLYLASVDTEMRKVCLNNTNVSHRFASLIPDEKTQNEFLIQAEGKGYSDDFGKIFPGIRRIAVPLLDGFNNRLTGAIGIGFLENSFQQTWIDNAVFFTKAKSSKSGKDNLNT